MAKLQLTLAASDYAHTREFTSGAIARFYTYSQ